jgi:tRNA-dihydrouridine synthase B
MAGWTDSAFRQIIKKICPEIICFTELTSADAIIHKNKKTENMLKFDKSEFPLIVQLFGKNEEYFLEAGKQIEKLGAAGIDINMGCPAKKIIKSNYGSGLLNNPEEAFKIVNKLSKNLKIPVSVKMRTGFDQYDEKSFIEFVKRIESAGAKLITIHGRTKKQAYSGKSDWDPIYLAKKHLKIPVIGNGDIDSAKTAKQRLASQKYGVTLDGIMVGRASAGNPWILGEIYAKLHNKKYTAPKSIKQKLPLIIDHFNLCLRTQGQIVGLLEMKKHLGAYLKGFESSSKYRQNIMQAKKPETVLEILENL